MRFCGTRPIAVLGLSLIFASAACGGSRPPPKAPATEAASAETEPPRDGSPAPDPAADAPKDPTADPTVAPKPAGSADDGSDIVPPFSSSKAPATAAPKTPKKKGGKKAKKKK